MEHAKNSSSPDYKQLAELYIEARKHGTTCVCHRICRPFLHSWLEALRYEKLKEEGQC